MVRWGGVRSDYKPKLPTEILAFLLSEIATKRHNYCPYLYKMFHSEYIEGLNQEQQEH